MATRRIIGWLHGSPIYALRGADGGGEVSLLIGDDDDGGSDDYDDDANEDGAGDGATAGTSTNDDGWPPSRDEWSRLRHAARTATQQAIQRKQLLRAAGISPNAKPDSIAPQTAAKADGDAARQSAQEQRAAAIAEAREQSAREQRLAIGLKREALRAQLREAGWTGGNFALAAKMVDFDAVEVDFNDDGEPVVTGLDDQVAVIRGEIPAWFGTGKKTPKPRPTEVAGAEEVDGGHRAAPPAKKPNWREQVSNQLGGVRR